MQQEKDRLTGRLAAYSNKHQLKYEAKRPDINDWFHRPWLIDLSRVHEYVGSEARQKQGSPQNLIWHG